ncbi:MAG: hypothetical protein HYS98_07210 [Deltaproteobacteria bacterium]|nr:hypothetical protein [Deltaproteobacteria bacterium]
MNIVLRPISLLVFFLIFYGNGCSIMDISVEPKRSETYKLGTLSDD